MILIFYKPFQLTLLEFHKQDGSKFVENSIKARQFGSKWSEHLCANSLSQFFQDTHSDGCFGSDFCFFLKMEHFFNGTYLELGCFWAYTAISW